MRGRTQTVVCCRTCCFVATWEQLLGELTPCLVVESVRKAGWHRGVKYRAVAEQGNGPCRRFMRENGSSESRERVGNGRLAGRLKSRIGDSHCQPGSQHLSQRNINKLVMSPTTWLQDGGNALVISEPKLSSRLSEAPSNAATGYYRFKSGNGH